MSSAPVLDLARVSWPTWSAVQADSILSRVESTFSLLFARYVKLPIAHLFITGNKWHRQAALPWSPVPSTEYAVRKAVECAKQVLRRDDFAAFKVAAEEYVRSGAWEVYQAKIHALALTTGSWMKFFWEVPVYRMSRAPLLESSSWIGFSGAAVPDAYQSMQNPAIARVSVLLNLMMKYRADVLDGVADNNLVFHYRGQIPLDASGCKRIYGTYRVPKEGVDEFDENPDSKHIIVLLKGHIFKLEVYGENGSLRSAEDLYKDLHQIYKQRERLDAVHVCTLTAQDRTSWAADFEKLSTDNSTHDAMEEIRRGLFSLSLDDDASWQTTEEAAEHGFHTHHNRWQDFPFQVCVNMDGCDFYTVVAHGPFDATAIAPQVDSILAGEDAALASFTEPSSGDIDDIVEGLANFRIGSGETVSHIVLNPSDSGVLDHVREASERRVNEHLVVEKVRFTEISKDALKDRRVRIKPDAIMQMAFQIAWKLSLFSGEEEDTLPHTYQSVSLRHFQSCRTEQAHPASSEMKDVVKVFIDEDSSFDERYAALKKAGDRLQHDHEEIQMGGGFDRLLLAHHCLAKLAGNEVEFLTSYFEGRLGDFKISSSQLPQSHGQGGIFLPTSKDGGVGVFYRPNHAGELVAFISGYKKDGLDIAETFARNLGKALEQVAEVVSYRVTDRES